MGVGDYIDEISFNGLELYGIWLSSNKCRAVGWYIYRQPNNIGKGYIPQTNTVVKVVPE